MPVTTHPPEIRICPVKQLYRLIASGQALHCRAIISSSSEPDKTRLGAIDYVFRQYDDIDVEIPGRSFSREDAAAFARFLTSPGANADILYCCCDAGESRSPAVAAAVSRYFSISDEHIWNDPRYHPNMLVFEQLADALGVRVSDEEKDLLIYTNRKAFSDALKKARR